MWEVFFPHSLIPRKYQRWPNSINYTVLLLKMSRRIFRVVECRCSYICLSRVAALVARLPCPSSKMHETPKLNFLRYRSCRFLHLASNLLLQLFRDLKNINDPNPEVQQTLAKHIRDACIDVGFFYGTHLIRSKGHVSESLHSIESRYLRRDHCGYP